MRSQQPSYGLDYPGHQGELERRIIVSIPLMKRVSIQVFSIAKRILFYLYKRVTWVCLSKEIQEENSSQPHLPRAIAYRDPSFHRMDSNLRMSLESFTSSRYPSRFFHCQHESHGCPCGTGGRDPLVVSVRETTLKVWLELYGTAADVP